MYEEIMGIHTLSWFQMIFTYGFWKLISIIMIPTIISFIITLKAIKSISYEGKHYEK